jgi:hypothetical protein
MPLPAIREPDGSPVPFEGDLVSAATGGGLVRLAPHPMHVRSSRAFTVSHAVHDHRVLESSACGSPHAWQRRAECALMVSHCSHCQMSVMHLAAVRCCG